MDATVASQVLKVRPSGLLTPSGKRPDGSLETGTPAEVKARAMMSLSAWCRWGVDPPFRRVRHFQPFPAVTTYG